MEVEIVKFDNLGRGIGYLNDKIIFVPKTVPGDIVTVNIKTDQKKYSIGTIKEIVKPSKLRQNAICPYFSKCGGCDLMHISLSNALEYKLEKVNSLLKKIKITEQVKNIIKCEKSINYRNKISLKVFNGEIGFYENNSHNLVPIQKCLICDEKINELIKKLKVLNIKNGEIVIRSNYKHELILIIYSEDELGNYDTLINEYLIIGIIKNDKLNNYLFKVSYNSFFQVNPFMCSKLFDLVKEYTEYSQNILDLYCGVGTLGIVASNKTKHVLGVEIIPNAIKDANLNKNFNGLKNAEFICADTGEIINKITNSFDTIILDPPRSGVSHEILKQIMNAKIEKIIYISCEPQTLVRDLSIILSDYKISYFTLLDMFVNTEHVESFVVLKHL